MTHQQPAGTAEQRSNGSLLSVESRVELLKIRIEEAHDHATLFMKAFAVFIAIHGLLLKLWIDSLKLATAIPAIICLTAIMVCALVVYVWRAWIEIRRAYESGISDLNASIGRPLKYATLLTLRYITATAGYFAILVLVGWLALLVFTLI